MNTAPVARQRRTRLKLPGAGPKAAGSKDMVWIDVPDEAVITELIRSGGPWCGLILVLGAVQLFYAGKHDLRNTSIDWRDPRGIASLCGG